MVYVLLAEGFEETEALTPVDFLRRAGIQVLTVGIGKERIRGAHGITVCADLTGEEAVGRLKNSDIKSDIQAVVFPGGMPGARNLDMDEATDAFISAALENDAFIAAICAAPMILGRRGLLRGRRAVCYPGYEKELAGATIADEGVVCDGKIICARAAGSAAEFSLALIAAIAGKDEADKVCRAVLI